MGRPDTAPVPDELQWRLPPGGNRTPEINWAHRMLSQSSASSLLRWSYAHWLKRAASVLSDVPLSVATYIAGGKLGFN